MIRVTVELVPYGVGEPRTIAEIKLWNDGTGNHEVGNYGVKANDNRRGKFTGKVMGYSRADGVLPLIARAIDSLESEA